jgi:ubiquinone/menaquinone biosynthesis C-methylase UbiE
MNGPKTWAASWSDPDHVLQLLGIQPELSVLEFCCDDSYFTVPLAKLVAGNLYVFDIDPEVLGRARTKISRAGLSVRGWIWDDTEDVARVLPDVVDVVFMANGFHAVSDKRQLAKTVLSALKPNGRFIVVEWQKLPRQSSTAHARLYGPANKTRMSQDETWLSEVVDLPPHHYGAIFRKAKHNVLPCTA